MNWEIKMKIILYEGIKKDKIMLEIVKKKNIRVRIVNGKNDFKWDCKCEKKNLLITGPCPGSLYSEKVYENFKITC